MFVKFSNDCFTKIIQRFFFHLGQLVGQNPWKCITVSAAISVICAAGLYKHYLDDDIRFGYTGNDAPSRYEFAVYQQFFNITVPFADAIFIESVDGGSLLRIEHFNASSDLLDFAMNELTVSTPHFANFSFMQSCGARCIMNGAFLKFREAFWDLKNGKSLDSIPKLIYPKMSIYGVELDISGHLFGIKLNDSLAGTNIEHIGLIAFYFHGDKSDQFVGEALEKWELALFKHTTALNSPLIKAYTFGDVIANHETMSAGITMLPLVAIGWCLMFLFVLTNVYLSASYYSSVTFQQLWIVIATIMSPICAVLTTFGLIAWAEEPLTALMCIIPLLVVAIGVDDAFLLLHSWQRLCVKHEDQTASQGLAVVMSEIGPSIAITSITNALAFAVGAFTPIPQIQRFCMATAIAISVDFVFELTIFSPVLTIIGKQAGRQENNSWLKAKNKIDNFLTSYASFVVSWKAKALACVTLVICWSVSLLGIVSMDVSFAPHKTFASDSPMQELHRVTSVIYNSRQGTSFFVNSPPSLPNNTELDSFKQLISDIESMPNSLGPNYTNLWLTDYESWVDSFDLLDWFGLELEAEDLNYDQIPDFLEARPMFRHAVKWHQSESGVIVDAFQFYAAFHNMPTWSDRVVKVQALRDLLSQYPQFNVSLWEYDCSIYDISLIVKQVTFAAGAVTMVTMFIVCLFFIPSLCSVVIATSAIGSICTTTLGLLSWWKADLDVFTMVNIIMSVGFSVDYTAHVVYHFHSQKCNNAEERVKATLQAVGLPMVQAAVSTVICVSLLGLHNVYMVVIFAKMVFLVVCCGLLHGLLILPTLLAALPRACTQKQESDTDLNEETVALN